MSILYNWKESSCSFTKIIGSSHSGSFDSENQYGFICMVNFKLNELTDIDLQLIFTIVDHDTNGSTA
jgi:hypothetical protein